MHSQRCENRHGQHRRALSKQTDVVHFCARTVNCETMRAFSEDRPIQFESAFDASNASAGDDGEGTSLQIAEINPCGTARVKAPSVCKGVLRRYHRYCCSRDRPSDACSTGCSRFLIDLRTASLAVVMQLVVSPSLSIDGWMSPKFISSVRSWE